MTRRPTLGVLGTAAIVSAVLVAFATWQRQAFRLGAAVAWVAALAVLWVAARATESGRREEVMRRPVGPPLSPGVEGMALLGVMVVALGLRFVLLEQVPAFIANDESMFVFETSWRPEHGDLYGLSLLHGWPAGWFPYLFGVGWNGFPGLSFFVHWLPMTVLGVSNWSLRCGCAAIGTLSIVALYCWARRWWGNVVAVGAALALSLNIEHIYWSRLALNNIDTALLSACVLAALAWALDTRRARAWVALGYALGFGFHTYHAAKLHLVWVVLTLLILAIGRRERWSPADGSGLLLCGLGAALVVAPLVPDIVAHWAKWRGDLAGRLDAPVLVAALMRGDLAAARFYLVTHFNETANLFRLTPVMAALFCCGTAITVWRWKDPRYLTALIWVVGTLVIGSATTGWRGARLVGAAPIWGLMPALAVGHGRAELWRGAPSLLRRLVAACAVVVLMAALYEAWWVEFVWRPQFRNTIFGICQVIRRLPLPATIYLAGHGQREEANVADAGRVCAILEDPRRHMVIVPPAQKSAPEVGADPDVVAIIFPDRADLLQEVRQRYPAALEEPFLLNGGDPTSGYVPGVPSCPRGTVAFYAVRLRSSCPAAPLLQTYDACRKGESDT